MPNETSVTTTVRWVARSDARGLFVRPKTREDLETFIEESRALILAKGREFGVPQDLIIIEAERIAGELRERGGRFHSPEKVRAIEEQMKPQGVVFIFE